jgi:hypothetical protein
VRFNGRLFDERSILGKLSAPLRSEILHYNSRELQPLVPLLRNTPEALFRAFAEHFEASIHFAGDIVIHEGQATDDAAHM